MRLAVAGWDTMTTVSDLIDTTEMYLRTIYELVEEDIVPLRARIAERLHQSGPTVSQTVARMERDGLLTVEGDRHLELTEEGHLLATRVGSAPIILPPPFRVQGRDRARLTTCESSDGSRSSTSRDSRRSVTSTATTNRCAC